VPRDEHSVHQKFEQLCALAALGEITQEESLQLQYHLESCENCRASVWEFETLVHEQLPLVAPPPPEDLRDKLRFLVSGRSYRKRFIRRAAAEGIGIPEHPPSYRAAFAAAACVAVLLSLVLGYRLYESSADNLDLARKYDVLKRKVAGLEERASAPAPVPTRDAAPQVIIREDPELKRQVQRTQSKTDEARHREGDLREQLTKAFADLQTLRDEMAASHTEELQVAAKLRETELALNRASNEIAQMRRAGQDDAASLSAQQVRIRELGEQVATYSASLDRESRLLTADRDIRDLMGARNLHLVDVYDVDAKGKNRPAFGRVFYTEGKSLIFYAFDLDTGRKSTNASFQVWGGRESKAESVRALGLLYVDDKKQNRWVLKFDDPKVLAQIDAVFVTVEPPGGSEKPHGQRLLYAYLNANPNHP
jgi:hypothetical protein